MTQKTYHYTESGLDDVYLVNGYDFVETEAGRSVRIYDIDGLHAAIARFLIGERKVLSGKEIRFLRHELLMSQNALARTLDVTEQTVRRWEQDKQPLPRSVDAILRALYLERDREQDEGGPTLASILKRIADIEDEADPHAVFENNAQRQWDVLDEAA
jgi:putative transcriptional regulator